MRTSLLSIVAVGAFAFSGAALSQSLTISDELSQAGTTVTVDVDYTGNATSRGGNFELDIVDPSLFSSISIECGAADQISGDFTNNCVFNAPDTFAIGILNQSDPLPSGNMARLVFTIDNAAAVGAATDIIEGGVNAWQDGLTITAGSVEVSSGPTPGLGLSGSGAFGGVEVGNSASNTFTVENSGDPGTTLELTSAPAIDPAGAEFEITGGTCANGTELTTNSCTIVVTYEPGATGPSTASPGLVVESNAGTESIELTGQGTAGQPDFSVTNTNIAIQGSNEGETVTGSFTASNNGPAASSVQITNCTVDTDPSASVSIDPTNATLAGGEAQQFTITATSPAVGGNYQAQIQCDVEEFDTDGTSIGTDTLDVTASVSTRPAVIPTLSNVGMVLFAMLIGLVGLVVVRQRA